MYLNEMNKNRKFITQVQQFVMASMSIYVYICMYIDIHIYTRIHMYTQDE
jgi:hypothetical protein